MDASKTGAFIATLRHEKGLTQTALAEQLHISNRTVSKWENGDGYPDIAILTELAAALSVSVDELLSGERNKRQPEAAQPYFTATYAFTRRLYLQGIKTFVSRKVPFTTLLLIGLCAVLLGLSMVNTLDRTDLTPLLNGILGTLAFLLLLMPLWYWLKSEKQRRLYQARNGGAVPPVSVMFGDKIVIRSGNASADYAYEDISGFFIGPLVYVIRFYKRLVLVIPREAFGEQREVFETFMRAKSPSTLQVKKRLKYRIINVLLFLIAVATVVTTAFDLYGSSSQFFYRDIADKARYFYQYEQAFNDGVAAVRSDSVLMQEVQQEGYAAYWAEDYLNLERVSDAEVTASSVTFDTYNGAQYYSGYVYYEGDGMPGLTVWNFEDGLVEQTQQYIPEDDLYLYGKTQNGSLSTRNWYLVKPLSAHWYYLELHTGKNDV